jgi:hypothetical protein
MAAQQPRGLRLSYARLHSARATVGITPRPGALPEIVERPSAEAILTAHDRSQHPLLFDHPDNLGFAKAALSHLFAPSKD